MTAELSLCEAHIHLQALRRNLRSLGDPRRAMPVIKSDAYGHGLVPVGRALDTEGVTHFAIATVGEALALREAGLRQTLVTLLGAVTPEEVSLAITHGITPLIHSFPSLDRAAAQASPEHPLDIVLKCDTGMSRLGFSVHELPALLDRLRAAPGLRPVLALSHLACSDMPEQDAYTDAQAATFDAMTATLAQAFPQLRRTLANSAASLSLPALHHDLMRPGLALYGCNPLHGTAREASGHALEPVMSVCAPVLQVRELEAGQSVSYGRTFTAGQPARCAVLAVGYADGYSRGLSGRGQVVIAGQRAPLRGRVCMGMIMVEITHITTPVREGDTAWLLGGPDDAAVSAQELADVWGTIPYEVLCLLGRNPHRYTE